MSDIKDNVIIGNFFAVVQNSFFVECGAGQCSLKTSDEKNFIYHYG